MVPLHCGCGRQVFFFVVGFICIVYQYPTYLLPALKKQLGVSVRHQGDVLEKLALIHALSLKPIIVVGSLIDSLTCRLILRLRQN